MYNILKCWWGRSDSSVSFTGAKRKSFFLVWPIWKRCLTITRIHSRSKGIKWPEVRRGQDEMQQAVPRECIYQKVNYGNTKTLLKCIHHEVKILNRVRMLEFHKIMGLDLLSVKVDVILSHFRPLTMLTYLRSWEWEPIDSKYQARRRVV